MLGLEANIVMKYCLGYVQCIGVFEDGCYFLD